MVQSRNGTWRGYIASAGWRAVGLAVSPVRLSRPKIAKGVIWEGAVENAHGVRLATKLAKQYNGPPAWHSVRLSLADLGGLDGDRAE